MRHFKLRVMFYVEDFSLGGSISRNPERTAPKGQRWWGPEATEVLQQRQIVGTSSYDEQQKTRYFMLKNYRLSGCGKTHSLGSLRFFL